jgi:hypothetical protein
MAIILIAQAVLIMGVFAAAASIENSTFMLLGGHACANDDGCLILCTHHC